jgi:phosphatidylglycerophosphate synthase
LTIYDLKPKFQQLLRPICNLLSRRGVTPNQVTVFALILSLGTGGLLLLFRAENQVLFIVPFVLFVRMALNAIDGMLAREHNLQSSLGAMLNELGDVISDSALYLPFALLTGAPAILIVLAVILAIISEMAGVSAVQIGASRRYDGPMGKSDRAFVFGLVALLLALGVAPGMWLMILFIGVNLLLILTIYNRINRVLQEAAR